MVKLLLEATPDDGKALVAEFGDQDLEANNVVTSLDGEQDRQQIIQMLLARGAAPIGPK